MATTSTSDDEADLPSWSRTYAGYRERFVNSFNLQLGTRQLVLEQAPCVSAAHARESKASADGSCTASTVWDAGIVLAALVHSQAAEKTSVPDQPRPRRRLLDLGSGTGIVGLAAAVSGGFSTVVLSDLPTVVPLLERNAAANAAAAPGTRIEVLPLAWDDADALRRAARDHGPYDLIVGGDLLYRPPVIPPLLNALTHLVGERTTVLLAASLQHSPETIRGFDAAARTAGFVVERLKGEAAMTDAWASDEVRVLRITRPPTTGTMQMQSRAAAPAAAPATAATATAAPPMAAAPAAAAATVAHDARPDAAADATLQAGAAAGPAASADTSAASCSAGAGERAKKAKARKRRRSRANERGAESEIREARV